MPPDDQARPWLPSAIPECPVEPDKQRWIESSLRWFAGEFGTAVLCRGRPRIHHPMRELCRVLIQRLLGKSVRIGDVTVRVTRGAVFGPGSLGLLLPTPASD